ncbi:transfer RNA nucleotidyltransferase [Cyathus striatus]|nr:transfer RNA nucleotidyltransferase [Cyathus striatus]
MMGLTFAEHLADFTNTHGISMGAIGKIAQNPEQSKHLETATFKIFNLDIDLVNLRSEEYTNDSRIPSEISFGTPAQDAMRRDITINALFYNVHTRAIEDFTGKGLDDLKKGIIRTPLNPTETFMDDPLRVLRCVRFSSRFGFDMVEDIKAAVKMTSIQDALKSKVARERCGEELTKMMKGRDPLLAIKLIHELDLYESIFCVLPEGERLPRPHSSTSAFVAASILATLLDRLDIHLPAVHPILLDHTEQQQSYRSRLFLASVLTPLRGRISHVKVKKSVNDIELAIKDSLKLGRQNHYADGIPLLFEAADLIPRRLKSASPSERVAIGTLLREKSVHNHNTGAHWTGSVLFSLVQELVQYFNKNGNVVDDRLSVELINSYNAFVQRISELNLVDAGNMKPVLNGKEVVEIVGQKAGPWVTEAMNRIIEWQLDHPEHGREECLEWLKETSTSWNVTTEPIKPAKKKIRIE